jgi:hypothetical protein
LRGLAVDCLGKNKEVLGCNFLQVSAIEWVEAGELVMPEELEGIRKFR